MAPSRRAVLRAGLGGAGLAGLSLAACSDRPGPAAAEPAAPGSAFGTGWLFGGEYVPGTEGVGYDDAAFTPVTLPHTVTPLSWGG